MKWEDTGLLLHLGVAYAGGEVEVSVGEEGDAPEDEAEAAQEVHHAAVEGCSEPRLPHLATGQGRRTERRKGCRGHR